MISPYAKKRLPAAVLITVLSSTVGLVMLMQSQAATFSVYAEAENGTVGGKAAPESAANASGNRSVRFGVQAGPSVNLKDFGALCNGVRDERPAFEAAIEDLMNKGGGVLNIPAGDCKVVHTQAALFRWIGDNITIRGVPGASRVSLHSDDPTAYRELFRIEGDNVAFEDLQLVKATPAGGVMLKVYPSSNLRLTRVTMDGGGEEFGRGLHAMELAGPPGGQFKNILIEDSTIRDFEFGLFQTNAAESIVDGFTVRRSSFTGNYLDDLEFNAPSGTMVNVVVTDSTFRDNRSDGSGSGFGVGLANVQHARLENNTFEGYPAEPVHIEDRSSDILVKGNSFKDSYHVNNDWASHVFIISASKFVTIENNTFDTAANTLAMQCIYIGSGGAAPVPSDIAIRNNIFRLRPIAKAVQTYNDPPRVTQSGNTTVNLP